MFPQSRLCLCDDGDCSGDGEELERKKAQNKSTHVNLSSLFILAKKREKRKAKKKTTLSLPLPLVLLDSQIESSKAHLPIQSNPILSKEPSLPPNLPLVFSFFPPSIFSSPSHPNSPTPKKTKKEKKKKKQKNKKTYQRSPNTSIIPPSILLHDTSRQNSQSDRKARDNRKENTNCCDDGIGCPAY